MQPSLFQSQVRVIFIGLLWWIPYLIFLRLLHGPVALVVALGAPILVAVIAAIVTGPFDLLAIVPLLIPAGLELLISAHINLVWHSRHVGTLLSPFPILDTLLVIAALIFGVIGIAAKRRLVPERGMKLDARQSRLLFTHLYCDLGLIVGILVALLLFDAAKIAYENNPHVLAETQKQILASPTATEADKLQVVINIRYRRSSEDGDVLQEALKSPFASVKSAAAASLLDRGDISGLPALEKPLMHSSKFTITNEHQAIHSDLFGYGEGGPKSLTFDLSQGLGSISDPGAEPILERLTASDDAEVSDAASRALHNFHLHDAQPKLNWMH